MHQVSISRTEPAAAPLTLGYREERLSLRQPRFAGRCVLVPDIDLKGYRCKAVVDFVDLARRPWTRRCCAPWH